MVALASGGEHSGGSNPDVLNVVDFPHLVVVSGDGKVLVTDSGSVLVGDTLGVADLAVGKAKVTENVLDVGLGAAISGVGKDPGKVLLEATSGVVDSGSGKASVADCDRKSLFSGQSLPFHPPVHKDGKILVQPAQERIADKLWGREGSVVIRFLAPSVYLINFPSQRVCDWVLESVVVSEPLAPVEIEEVLIVGNEIRDLSTIDSQVEAVVDCEDQSDLSSRPERIAAGGVAHLMEQLKPKDKGGAVA
ncbi:hypothetical protein V6N11_069251 [Hibiscus sabdariffa]|uniref:Uncharacterized protein n=1 Tax=Hibiscus sabdariffa TaxID=183260 RepID=A0ABR2NB85_9ROSI